jgi:hypothetical protein
VKKTQLPRATHLKLVPSRETKVIKSHNFYPAHYLESVLEDDIRGLDSTGAKLKELRTFAQKEVFEALSDAGTNAPEKQQINTDFIQRVFESLSLLGDTKSAGDAKISLALDPKGRSKKAWEMELVRRVELRNETELWCISEAVCLQTATSENLANNDETLISKPCSLILEDGQQDGAEKALWREVLDKAFDSDRYDVAWIMVCTGAQLYLFKRESWVEEGEAWLEASMQDLYELNSDKHYSAVEALFGAKAFPIESPENHHDTLQANAHRKAAEVSRALRETVRESIELLANEALEQLRQQASSLTLGLAGKFPKNHPWAGRDLNIPEQRALCAQELFENVLRCVYRLLFILVVEGRPQAKRALPVGTRAYQLSFALEKIRDLESVPLVASEKTGSFIWKTLQRQTELYFSGFQTNSSNGENTENEGTSNLLFYFPALKIDLFNPQKTPLLNQIGVSDRTMQKVIQKLSLAKTGSGKGTRTHRVYYGGLSLNRLGEVYEGLLSLRPVILSEKMIVLKSESSHQAPMLLPMAKKKSIDEDKLAKDENNRIVTREAETFALLPTGFERKLSASFYTPEELTKFLAFESVGTFLASLGKKPSATDTIAKIEKMKICEPAMGNGAFCNAVVDELAKHLGQAYLQQFEKTKPKDVSLTDSQFSLEWQKTRAKDHLLKNCVYGVDLNPTAVELAKVSLWLNALHKDGSLPFLDHKLRCGNSLVGAWVNRNKVQFGSKNISVPHFLIPHPGCLQPHFTGVFLSDKKRPFLANEKQKKKLEALRTEYVGLHKSTITSVSLEKRIEALAMRVHALWEAHSKERESLQSRISQDTSLSIQQREELALKSYQNNTAYNSLRHMMDLWCALWFWPHSEIESVPSLEDFLLALEEFAKGSMPYGGEELTKQIKKSGLEFLHTVRAIALKQKFFHWDLEFAEILSGPEKGFDLVLGNPPWAPVRWEEGDFFESLEMGISATEGDAGTRSKVYDHLLSESDAANVMYQDAHCERNGHSNFLNNSLTYDFSDSSGTNTYKFFYQRFLQITQPGGVHGMIAQDGLMTDKGNLEIRPTFYRELKKGFRFHNELQLFSEVHHMVQFFVWISARGSTLPNFDFIDNLYHPETVARCRTESDSAPYRGMKDDLGKWELRGHPKRILNLDAEALGNLAQIEGETEYTKVSLPIVHGSAELETLFKLGAIDSKLGIGERVHWSRSFEEDKAPKLGWTKKSPCHGKGISRSCVTGPNIYVATPFYKEPNPGCKNNLDYSEIDLETISVDRFPETLYEVTDKGLKSDKYNAVTPWGVPEIEHFRLFGRAMVSTTGARTLSTGIFPPKVSHINRVFSLSFKEEKRLVDFGAMTASLIFDFLARSISGGEISKGVLSCFPERNKNDGTSIVSFLHARALRLNCLSNHYAPLVERNWSKEMAATDLPSAFAAKRKYSQLSDKWIKDFPIRNAQEREQALCEIDACVAILFGITKQTLLDLYRSQFGVLQKNLQDLPNQNVDPQKYHFPRYQAMADAYDALLEIHQGKFPKKRA